MMRTVTDENSQVRYTGIYSVGGRARSVLRGMSKSRIIESLRAFAMSDVKKGEVYTIYILRGNLSTEIRVYNQPTENVLDGKHPDIVYCCEGFGGGKKVRAIHVNTSSHGYYIQKW